ncbi:MAG: conjugative relaxase [Frankiales bacterium]|nr:conjugative relaxase [Frankiales bacterium]
MISVHAIRGRSPGAVAAYYLQPKSGCERELDGLQPAGPAGVGRELGLDPDYYLNNPEAVGRWIGQGSAALGLDWPLGGPPGEESRMAFLNALYGNVNGFNVAKPVTRYDENGAKVNVRVAAYDVTISAPKSVSTLMALAPPPIARKVLAAHDHAATEAIGLLEQLSARAARGHHGDGQRATRIGTDGFLAAAFDHTTSRAHDPQLHTHVVVMNLVHGQDGKWSALDSRTLHRQATTASYLYQHLLRAELTRELGVDWEPVERGVAEIAGIPKSVRREFSTRRAQIEASLDTRATGSGLRGRARTLAAKAACLATRPAKTHTEPGSLRRDWAARAQRLGFGSEHVEQLLTQEHSLAALDRDAVSARVLGAAGATRERPTFDQGTVLRELIAALPAGTDLDREQLLDWTRKLIHRAEVVPVAESEVRSYTTGDMLATEQRLLTLASRSGEPLAVVPAAQSLPILVRSGLRPEQRDIAQILLGSGRPVDVISGPAGSGKTRGLAAAVTVWHTHGIAVRGTAVAALTAQGLQDATRAESVSLTRVLNQPTQHLPERGVLLVDEAGMIGTRQLLRLLTVAQQRGCKVVLVGDPAQLPELEAGGAFAALTRQPDALHLDGHGRQTEAWEQQALHDLRSGRPATALDAYQAHDRLQLATTRDELLTGLVRDYLGHRREHTNPWQVAVLAPRRHDVDDLNTLIRHQLVAKGVLGWRRILIETSEGPRDYRKGDQVIVTRNHHDRQLLNGARATVRTVRRDGLVLQLTDGRRVVLDKAWLAGGDLDHGYAMTLHKAQGRTVHTSLVLADEGLSQEGGYVGLSRGTSANHLYLDAASEHAVRDCDQLEHASPSIAPSRSKALSRSSRQALALDVHLVAGEPPARHAPRLEGPSR